MIAVTMSVLKDSGQVVASAAAGQNESEWQYAATEMMDVCVDLIPVLRDIHWVGRMQYVVRGQDNEPAWLMRIESKNDSRKMRTYQFVID